MSNYHRVVLAVTIALLLSLSTTDLFATDVPADDAVALRAEIAKLRAEVAALAAKLEAAEKANAELTKKLAAKEGTGGDVAAIPRDGTETSLAEIIANREKFWEERKVLTVIGGAYVEDDAGWLAGETTFRLKELRDDKKAGRLGALVSISRVQAKPLLDAIVAAAAKGQAGKVVRLKVSVYMNATGTATAEKLLLGATDYQILDAASNTWGPWQVGKDDAAKPKAAPDAKPVKLAELMATARRWLAEPAGETAAAKDIRHEKISGELIGRRIELAGTLTGIFDDGGENIAIVKYESTQQVQQAASSSKVPAETAILRVPVDATFAASAKTGARVFATATISRVEFSTMSGGVHARVIGTGATIK